jgi:hypothetical protein
MERAWLLAIALDNLEYFQSHLLTVDDPSAETMGVWKKLSSPHCRKNFCVWGIFRSGTSKNPASNKKTVEKSTYPPPADGLYVLFLCKGG